jgi:hypothetical protein
MFEGMVDRALSRTHPPAAPPALGGSAETEPEVVRSGPVDFSDFLRRHVGGKTITKKPLR